MKEFDEVIGYEDVKAELERIVDMMVNPGKYQALGVNTTRGLLFDGEPGVGKTLMAECFIKASKRKSFTIRKDVPDGDFIKLIKKTFDEAKNTAPSIVFLDDIDKFANEDAHHKNVEQFVTIQSCIDDCKGIEVFVLATANDTSFLPSSLLRAGRFDKNITIDAPRGKDAEDIVRYYLKQKKIAKNVDCKEVARLLNGRSCASLETVINEAGIYAGFENREYISMDDLTKSFMRVIYNAPESIDLKESKYLRNIAVHEAGHVVVGEILEPESVSFATCKKHDGKRGGGFTIYERDDDYFESKHFMENRVVTLLAGRAAIEVVYGVTDVGANNDLHGAFKIVERFVDNYCGFGFQYWEGCASSSSNSLLERKIQLVQTETERYYQKAKKIIIENREFLDKVVDVLVDKKTIVFNEIQGIKMYCKNNPATY